MMAHSVSSSSMMRSVRPAVRGPSACRSNVLVCRVGKTELISQLSDQLQITKTAAGDALDALVGIITEKVTAGEKVAIMGFGTFERRERSARKGRNPQTGEPLDIDACFTPGFTAGKRFKETVNGKVAEPRVPKVKAAPKPKVPKADKPAASKPAAAKPAAPAKPAVAKAAAAGPVATKPKAIVISATAGSPPAAKPVTKKPTK